MILVDTSIWVDHLRRGNADLRQGLRDGQILCHPFVIGELGCGHLANRSEILDLLGTLPQARLAEHSEVLGLVDSARLYGLGLGWIDMHLLASSLLSRCRLWTGDRRLRSVARLLNSA